MGLFLPSPFFSNFLHIVSSKFSILRSYLGALVWRASVISIFVFLLSSKKDLHPTFQSYTLYFICYCGWKVIQAVSKVVQDKKFAKVIFGQTCTLISFNLKMILTNRLFQGIDNWSYFMKVPTFWITHSWCVAKFGAKLPHKLVLEFGPSKWVV